MRIPEWWGGSMRSPWRDGSYWGLYAAFFLLVCAILVCGQSAASEVRAVPCTIKAPGETGESAIVIDQVSPGLSEFEVQVTLTDPAIAEITGVRFPSWAGLNSKSGLPSDTVTMKAADLQRRVNPGDRDVVLATITIRGDLPGTSILEVKVKGMRDESGSPYTLPGRNGTLTVNGQPPPQQDAGSVAQGNPGDVPPTMPAPSVVPGTTLPAGEVPAVISTPDVTPVVQADVTPDATVTPGEESGNQGGDQGSKPGPGVTGNGAGGSVPAGDGAKPGVLCIDSKPGGATITVDGRQAGATPGCFEIEAGTHRIGLVPAGEGQEWEGDVTISGGETLSLPPFMLGKIARYTIDASTGPHGSVYPSGILEVMGGKTAEFFFSPDPGYRLEGVIIDGTWDEPRSRVVFEDVSSDHVLYGSFARIPQPRADYSANVTDGFAPLAVGFCDLSTGNITARFWNFGDDMLSRDPSPVHMYERAGLYTVTLEVCGEGGCDIEKKENHITVRERVPPRADFSANVTGGYAPLAVGFSDSSTGEISALHWRFGDGSGSSDPSPVHVYRQAGNYTVSLEACGDQGCGMVSRDSFITVLEQYPLLADFSQDNTSGQAPLLVQFSDLSTGAPDSWSWDFGDGNTSTDPSPAHTYLYPGTYTVRLTISNGEYASSAEKEGLVNVTSQVIGGDIGYFLVRCTLEGAHVYFDGEFKGVVVNGTLTVPVYITGTPYTIISVKEGGTLVYSSSIGSYPEKDGTVVLDIPVPPVSPDDRGRFRVPALLVNTTHILPNRTI